jgi:hypothetical protein
LIDRHNAGIRREAVEGRCVMIRKLFLSTTLAAVVLGLATMII